jgi:hypothetical protein
MIFRRPWFLVSSAVSLLLAVACAAGPTASPGEVPPPPASAPPATSVALVESAPPAVSAPPVASDEPDDPDEEPGRPLPAGFVHVSRKGEARCGQFRVDLPREPKGEPGLVFARVRAADGSAFHEVHGREYKFDPDDTTSLKMYLSVEFCGDLTGDGVPELVLTERTMGAHCCYTHQVISLTSPVKNLMTWEKGDMGTPLWPARYRPAGPWQIEGRVVFSPAFPKGDEDSLGLSYASMPVVPVVFSFQKGGYQMTSLSFPEAYRKSRAEIEARCKASPDECEGELIVWIDSLAIGDWAGVSARPMFKEALPTLRRASGPTRQALRALGTEARPGKLNLGRAAPAVPDREPQRHAGQRVEEVVLAGQQRRDRDREGGEQGPGPQRAGRAQRERRVDRHRAVGRGKTVHVRVVAPDLPEHPGPHGPGLVERAARVAHREKQPEGRAHGHDGELPSQVAAQRRSTLEGEPRAHAERMNPQVHQRRRRREGQRGLPRARELVRPGRGGERPGQVIHPRPQGPRAHGGGRGEPLLAGSQTVRRAILLG